MKKYVEIEFRKGDSQIKERRIFRNATHADLEGKLLVIRTENKELFVLNIEADILLWMSVEDELKPTYEQLDGEVLQIALGGQVIFAVKRYREVTGCTLIESKNHIDKLVAEYKKINAC